MPGYHTRKNPNKTEKRINLMGLIVNKLSLILIPAVLLVPTTNSFAINRINKDSLPIVNIFIQTGAEIESNIQSLVPNQQRIPENIRTINIQQIEPSPTENQPEKPQPTKTPKPTSTPIPTPPPSDPSTNNLMAIFGILIVVVIIMGIWINWRRVFR